MQPWIEINFETMFHCFLELHSLPSQFYCETNVLKGDLFMLRLDVSDYAQKKTADTKDANHPQMPLMKLNTTFEKV
jgi:hypothetical protein